MNEPDQKQAEEKQAKARFLFLNLMRLCGAVFIAFGLAIIANGFMRLPVEFGYLIFAVGVFEFIALPVILSRHWQSPPSQ
jgi:hypothetical protein